MKDIKSLFDEELNIGDIVKDEGWILNSIDHLSSQETPKYGIFLDKEIISGIGHFIVAKIYTTLGLTIVTCSYKNKTYDS